MATIFEQLEQGLQSGDLTSALGTQVGSLTGIANAVSGLASHPPSSIGDFGSALSQLPMPQLSGGYDLLGSLTSIQGALPTDLSSVTGDLTSGLGSIGARDDAHDHARERARGRARRRQDRPDRLPLRAAAGAGGGGGGGGGAVAVVVAVAAAAALRAAPAPNPAATSSSTRSAGCSTCFRPTSTSTSSSSSCAGARDPGRDILPAIVPVIDDLNDPLVTLVAWKNMSTARSQTQLADTLGAAATLVGSRLDAALAPLATDLAALAPHFGTTALGAAAAGIVTRLGELEAAVDAATSTARRRRSPR